jgi:hypothetical protein
MLQHLLSLVSKHDEALGVAGATATGMAVVAPELPDETPWQVKTAVLVLFSILPMIVGAIFRRRENKKDKGE